MSSNAAIASLNGVDVRYTKRSLFGGEKITRVLQNIDFSLYHGETLGIIGRNGAGKSTLLKLLAGILQPSSGQVSLDSNATVALLTYQLGFAPHLTGRENAIYSGLLYGMTREKIEQALDEIFEFAGLESYADVAVAHYSAGMKARLGFTVALWADPDIILIDEALGVGDHDFRRKSSNAIRKWIKTDKTVVFVSHDEQSVRALCDRVIWLEFGGVVFEGDVETGIDIYLSYENWIKNMTRKHPEWTEDFIRQHPNNRNPVQVMQTMRSELNIEWGEERIDAQAKYKGAVKFHYPSHGQFPQHIIDQQCGCEGAVWIEHGSEVMRASYDELMVAKAQLERSLQAVAARSKTTAEELRNTSLYTSLLDLLRH